MHRTPRSRHAKVAHGDFEDLREGPAYPMESLARQLMDDDFLVDEEALAAWVNLLPRFPARSRSVDEWLRLEGSPAQQGIGPGFGLQKIGGGRKQAADDGAPVVLAGDPFQPNQNYP